MQAGKKDWRGTFSKQEWMALGAIGLFILLFFKPVVAGDGFGYYVILEGAVRDHTLNLSNQLRYNEVAGGEEVFFVKATGTYASQYAPGLPLLSAPAYAVSLVLDDVSLFHVQDEFFLQERGDILIHQASMALTSLVLAIVALVASLLLCRQLGLKQGGVALALAFFGSPMIRYASYDLTYTHAAEAGILAVALYFFWKERPVWQLGLMMGLMTLVRFTSAFFFLPFLGYFAWKKEWKKARDMVLGGLPFALAIMLYFQVQFGSPFATGYTSNPGYDAKNFSFVPFFLDRVLFSLGGNPPGLLWWTPLVLLGFVGLWFLKDERKWVLLGIVALMFYTTASFFEGTTGFSYSNRYFAALFPITVIGVAALLQEGKEWNKASWVLGAYGFLMFLFVFPIDWGHFAGYGEVLSYWILQGHLLELPGALYSKLGFVRLVLQQ